MKKDLTWLGHNAWRLRLGETIFIVDPFFRLPNSPVDSSIPADYVLVSHGHADHCADAEEMLKKNNATLVALAEVADWYGKHGIKKIEAMNIGGSIPISVDDGRTQVRLMMVPAVHSSTMPDGRSGGNSCGFLISIPNEGKSAGFGAPIRPLSEIVADCLNIYFACDTGWTAEMPWLGSLGIDLAILPIGDRYTLGPPLSLDVIAAIRPKTVIPGHYNSWPPIRQDAPAWAEAVRNQGIAEPVVLEPGETYTF
ncbi:MAG: metal-dependent hydrolase [Thermoguttaceae bacterium]|jgi:L-ascorbate metabolism protein UlaG (beta-lactamase superfamily)